MGVQPLYGLHLLLCLVICLPFRLDALLAYAAANISNPLLAPLIVLSEIQIGSLIVDGKLLTIHVLPMRGHAVGHLALQLGVGSVLLGAVLSALGGSMAAMIAHYAIQKRNSRHTRLTTRDLAQAIERTRERYRSARAPDRHYVANKLRFDSIIPAVCESTAQLGDVVDVGCGRGQLGLVLYELGRIRSLTGFDWDERKVATATIAARGDAHYFVSDICSAPIPEADTIFIVDVLHYLTFPEQDALIARAAAALRRGGMLIVRDVDARRTWSSLFTQWCERMSIRGGINRGRILSFRSCEEQREAVVRNGLVASAVVATPGLLLDNVLLFAVRPNGEHQGQLGGLSMSNSTASASNTSAIC